MRRDLELPLLLGERSFLESEKPRFLVFRRYVRAALYLFNIHTVCLSLIACGAVYFCIKIKLYLTMDFAIMVTGLTFPIVFTVSQAFARREKAISMIAQLKASVVCLYWHHRDWDQSENYPLSLGNNGNRWAREFRDVTIEFLRNLGFYLSCDDYYESLSEKRLAARRRTLFSVLGNDTRLQDNCASYVDRARQVEQRAPSETFLRNCYHCLSKMSAMNEYLTYKSKYTRGGEGGLSRTNQYLRYTMWFMEELRTIKEYRTPAMMRYGTGVLLHLVAFGLAPYFAHFCASGDGEIEDCPGGYASAIAFFLIMSMLYKIEIGMEDPFSKDGLDSVVYKLDTEFEGITDDRRVKPFDKNLTDFVLLNPKFGLVVQQHEHGQQ